MKQIQPKTPKGHNDWLSGAIDSTIILRGVKPSRVRIGSVQFAPGEHTAWHSHAVGQYLYIIEGIALVQERGVQIQILQPGQIIYTKPGVKHWHGASNDSFMVHLAVWEAPDNDEEETSWGKSVTDEEYNKHLLVC